MIILDYYSVLSHDNNIDVNYIIILIMNNAPYGKYHDENAIWKHNVKDNNQRVRNSVTRRNKEVTEGTIIIM